MFSGRLLIRKRYMAKKMADAMKFAYNGAHKISLGIISGPTGQRDPSRIKKGYVFRTFVYGFDYVNFSYPKFNKAEKFLAKLYFELEFVKIICDYREILNEFNKIRTSDMTEDNPEYVAMYERIAAEEKQILKADKKWDDISARFKYKNKYYYRHLFYHGLKKTIPEMKKFRD